MKEGYFVNIAFDKAIKSYLANQNNKDGINYNSFLVVTIRILTLIYGEAAIINPYYLNNEVVFFNNLNKYGMNKTDLAIFKEDFLNYYNFEKENTKRKIKNKNPYFKTVLKYLVNMFILKKRKVEISDKDEETFLDLAYTSHTKNPYRVSYNYLMSDDITYIENYYNHKINELDMTKDLKSQLDFTVNLDVLKYVGVNLTNLEDMSRDEILEAQNKAYNYFEVDVSNSNYDEDSEKYMDYFNSHRKKVTTGNGYVDILLLMSVIVTSFSILAIIIFSLM